MELDTIALGLAGMVAQLLDGVLGMGYGVSAATILIALGMAPTVVSATVHAAKLPTSGVSGLAHLREGNVELAIALPLAIGGAAGGIIGALVLVQAASESVRPLVALLLLGLGIRMVISAIKGVRPEQRTRLLPTPALLLLGLMGGCLDAFGGGGWGPTCASVLMTTDGREPRKLIGSVNLAEVVTATAVVATLAATVRFESFAFSAIAPLVVGGVLIAPLAARVCSRANARVLASGFGTALVALNASVLTAGLDVAWLQLALWVVAAAAAGMVVLVSIRLQTSVVEEP